MGHKMRKCVQPLCRGHQIQKDQMELGAPKENQQRHKENKQTPPTKIIPTPGQNPEPFSLIIKNVFFFYSNIKQQHALVALNNSKTHRSL